MKRFNKRLAQARVHVGGCGRIGSAVVLALHAAGVGYISSNDPQVFEEEQLPVWAFSRRSDIGRPKVHVLERFLDGRCDFVLMPVVAPNQSRSVRPFLEQADVFVSCANDLSARLYLERMAVKLKKPCVQACAQDGRAALGGLITIWVPGANHSCFGCLFPDRTQIFRRGEILLPCVTSTIGALASHIVTEMLGADAFDSLKSHNVFRVDLGAFTVEPMSIQPRTCCRTCGGAARQEKA